MTKNEVIKTIKNAVDHARLNPVPVQVPCSADRIHMAVAESAGRMFRSREAAFAPRKENTEQGGKHDERNR